ncbi:hypothetical protein ACLESO_12525 [Pyxidicoccus sp. 3LG]
MEWLEFPRWSPEVERQLSQQAARLGATMSRGVLPARRPAGSATVAAAYRLSAMLRVSPPHPNPWGHPASEC